MDGNTIKISESDRLMKDKLSQQSVDAHALFCLDVDEFIRTAYSIILCRMPDPDGFAHYKERLLGGTSRTQILGELAASSENDCARQWYQKLRWPYLALRYRNAPLIGWFFEMVCAMRRYHVRELVSSDDSEFIYRAYQAILGRLPEEKEFAHYLDQLRSNNDKLAVLAELKLSPEGRTTRGRVAGLTALSWYFYVKSLPASAKDNALQNSAGAATTVRQERAELSLENKIVDGRQVGLTLPQAGTLGWPLIWMPETTRRLLLVNRLFLATVVLPTFLSIVYYGLIASDVYISESRFVVRSPQRQSASGLGVLLQGTGFSRSQDDAYSVHNFMISRDALQKLDAELSLGEAFGSSKVDLFSRFNSLGLDNSFEALYRYYQKRIGLDLDTASSISVLKVRAYTAEDAYLINERLLQMGENLINQVNERGRQDMIRFALSEVAIAEDKAKAASLALSGFRSKKEVFDPEKQSALQLQQVSKLQEELIATKTQLDQVRTFAPDNPQIASLQKRAESIRTEINAESAKVTGRGSSLTSKAAEYERLALERVFADKQLGATLASLEQARNDAQRKQLYLERIVQPNKPDLAMEPRRLRNVLSTFLLSMIVWGILTILISGIREHHD